MGFAVGGPYNEWLTTFDTLEEDAGESLDQLGFLGGDVMMLGLAYVYDNQENIEYFERLFQAGITLARCDETRAGSTSATGLAGTAATTTTNVTAASAAQTEVDPSTGFTTTTSVPPNPGNTVSCADFDIWEDAQEWYDTYAPHYGDVALIDINNNIRIGVDPEPAADAHRSLPSVFGHHVPGGGLSPLAPEDTALGLPLGDCRTVTLPPVCRPLGPASFRRAAERW